MKIIISLGILLGFLSTAVQASDDLVGDSDVTCESTPDGGLVCTTPPTANYPGCTRTCGPGGDCGPWVCPPPPRGGGHFRIDRDE